MGVFLLTSVGSGSGPKSGLKCHCPLDLERAQVMKLESGSKSALNSMWVGRVGRWGTVSALAWSGPVMLPTHKDTFQAEMSFIEVRLNHKVSGRNMKSLWGESRLGVSHCHSHHCELPHH